MSYTGYSEGTFSEQINNFRGKVNNLERQLIQLNETLISRDREIKHLKALLEKHIDLINSQLESSQEPSTVALAQASKVSKQKK